jgi:type IV secretory pathway VirB9-like protein
MLKRLLAGVAFAAVALPAVADDAHFVSVLYRADRQTTVLCPAGLLCTIRLEAGERVRDGLNSQVPAWDPCATGAGGSERTCSLIKEGEAAPTPFLVFRPSVPGLRANVVVTTNRRTYFVLLESVAGAAPTYVSYRYAATATHRVFVRPKPAPLTIVEQLELACSWQTTNAPGESYTADAKPARWRPVHICHDARQTWLALPPLRTVASDLPVLHELTPEGERLANYAVFAVERIIRVDGVGNGYVLRDGGRHALHIHRVVPTPPAPEKIAVARTSAAPAPVATIAPDPVLQRVLGAGR